VLGEELGRFRDASKDLYRYLEAFTWSGKVERLGFDEVFMDITDIVDYNQNLLNPNDLAHSFFSLERNDPTVGFTFDATKFAGHTYPPQQTPSAISNSQSNDWLTTRLILGSHFAQHLRLGLDEEKGYTSSVGISTNKLLSKLVGNLNKPKAQTTLLPPYDMLEDGIGYNAESTQESNVMMFIDGHDIGKIPGIGFKMAQRIRNHILSRPPEFGTGLGWGGSKESVTVRDVRLFPGMGPEMLERILGGLGVERGIGGKAWGLINGIDDTEIQKAKKVPSQISIEDSYGRLDTMPQVLKELRRLATSLIKRMHTDLLEDDDDPESGSKKRWIANPKTVRLSTRPRPPPNADGTRTRSFNRISRSGPLPSFVFNLNNGIDSIVEKLVQESLLPMFKRLHPPHGVWNLSLINIGVTNMVETARADGSGAGGRDISKMFKRQESTLKEWRVADRDVPPAYVNNDHHQQAAEPSAGDEAEAPDDDNDDDILTGSEDATQNTIDDEQLDTWEEGVDGRASCEICRSCGAVMPAFAMPAHERFHSLEVDEEE
jgi:DNA polymerase iota